MCVYFFAKLGEAYFKVLGPVSCYSRCRHDQFALCWLLLHWWSRTFCFFHHLCCFEIEVPWQTCPCQLTVLNLCFYKDLYYIKPYLPRRIVDFVVTQHSLVCCDCISGNVLHSIRRSLSIRSLCNVSRVIGFHGTNLDV